ncbi:MAG: hypothetical protein U9O87_04850 [Verrucomicrobiota bacterium]|nr:hypothetical protein [Verrucomicrobiota bacterium]
MKILKKTIKEKYQIEFLNKISIILSDEIKIKELEVFLKEINYS